MRRGETPSYHAASLLDVSEGIPAALVVTPVRQPVVARDLVLRDYTFDPKTDRAALFDRRLQDRASMERSLAAAGARRRAVLGGACT